MAEQTIYQGKLIAHKGAKIAIVISRFNELITKSLLEGALDCLNRLGMPEKDITTIWVPGAYEIPVVAKQLAKNQKYEAIICLGAVIRGATPHFDYVAGQTASGIASIALESTVPVIFGVLTTESIEQALERAGTKSGNKGYESALAAIEMIDLMRQIRN